MTKFSAIIMSNKQARVFWEILLFPSAQLDHEYLILEQADIHEDLLVSLGVSRAHVISHDYGDTVALELLHRSVRFSATSWCMIRYISQRLYMYMVTIKYIKWVRVI